MVDKSEKFKEVVYKNIKVDGLVNDCLDEILEPSLQELVDGTETEFDNIAMAALYPSLEKKLKEKVTAYYSKVLGQEQAA